MASETVQPPHTYDRCEILLTLKFGAIKQLCFFNSVIKNKVNLMSEQKLLNVGGGLKFYDLVWFYLATFFLASVS